MRNEKQAGFILWETILLSIFLCAMVSATGLYVRAVQLQQVAAMESCADYLARAQISYAQAKLDNEGCLPPRMEYMGDIQDLQPNDVRYMVNGEAVLDDDGVWQLQIQVVWTKDGRQEMQKYQRCLVKH